VGSTPTPGTINFIDILASVVHTVRNCTEDMGPFMTNLKEKAAKSAKRKEQETGPTEEIPFWARDDIRFDSDGIRLIGPKIPFIPAVEQHAKDKPRRQREHIPGTDYTPQELAVEWGLSTDKIRELFANEAGVKKIRDPRAAAKGKRHYTTLRIPENVAERVAKKLS
jgi:hypothetical protein